ncbi:MAG: DUF5686 family protein [Bacteroidales bacterium]
MRKSYLIILCFLSVHISFGQRINIEGKVIDANDREPLAFVNVLYGEPPKGTTSDIDGKFQIEIPSSVQSVKFSYLGYHSKTVSLESLRKSSMSTIALKSKSFALDEVVVKPGTNPAVQVIQKVYKNREEHNPENMDAFSYRSYNKFVFTIDSSRIDECTPEKSSGDTMAIDTTTVDSTDIKLRRFMDKQHILLMESVSERKYLSPGYSNEQVLASRVSGFSDPSLVFLATQIQSFSFYDNFISLGDKSYINPISKNSARRYLFLTEDTLYHEPHDTTVIISFRPRKNKNFDGLKGMLHVNTCDYSLTRVIAEPVYSSGNFTIKIQQKYDRIGGERWFPTQLNTRIGVKEVFVSSSTRDYHLVGDGRSYIRDIYMNPPLDKSDFDNTGISVPSSAYERSEEFWKRYRVDKLSSNDSTTYQVIDSIGEAHHFDARMKRFKTLSTGYYPVSFLNLDLTRLLNYNEYEGFRLGMGLMTNEELSEFFSAGGYFGYGFRDKDWKYGGRLRLNIHEKSESRLEVTYKNDVAESGGYQFLKEQGVFSPAMYRQYLVESMDWVKERQMSYSLRTLKYLKLKLFIRKSTVNPLEDYRFRKDGNVYQGNFHITEGGFKARFAWKEEFAETPWGKFSLETDFPVVYANFTRGMNILNGNFEYTKVEAAISNEIRTKNLGKTKMQLVGGMIGGPVPAFNLYTGHGSYGSRLNIYSEHSFATMRLSEFLADRFVSVYLNQDFKSLLFRKEGFSPNIMWLNNLGWGWLNKPSRHDGMNTQSFAKGYFETGVMADNILGTSLFNYGFGIFYRYGPYAFDKFSDNLAYKISIGFNL